MFQRGAHNDRMMCGERFSVVGLLPLVLVVLGLSSPIWAANKNVFTADLGLHDNNPRFDAEQDPTTSVTLSEAGPQSKLFRDCLISDSANVRFHSLYFPDSGEKYTRYVPNADQLSSYDPAWTAADTTIGCFLECSSYAESNAAMMFKYDGTSCQVSNMRLSTGSPGCSSTEPVDAYFVRTSCEEPEISGISLTPTSTTIDISWDVTDECNLASNVKVSWNGGASSQILDISETSFTIDPLTYCSAQTIVVTAVDSTGADYGVSDSDDTTTLTGDPAMETVTVSSVTENTITIDWVDQNHCDLITSYEVTWGSAADQTKSVTAPASTVDITDLGPCETFTITVMAMYPTSQETNTVTTTGTTDDLAPSMVSVSTNTVTENSINIVWVVNDDCELITGYEIVWGDAADQRHTALSSESTYEISGLDPCTEFDISVTGLYYTEDTTVAATTTGSTDDTAPTMISVNVVEQTEDTITVQWMVQDDCGVITDYEIVWGTAADQTLTVTAPASSYVIENLSPCTTYPITVTALYPTDARSNTEDTSGTTDTVAAVLQNLVLTRTFASITVTWDFIDECSLASELKVEWSGAAITDGSSSALSVNTGSYTIQTTSCDLVTVVVTAVDAASSSVASATSTTSDESRNCGVGNKDLCGGCVSFSSETMTLDAADSYCESAHGPAAYPFTVSSAAELEAFRAVMTADSVKRNYWVALTRPSATTDAVWSWDTGYEQTTAAGNPDWRSSEPNSNTDLCAIAVGNKDYLLEDQSCSDTNYVMCIF